jgi:hypothetical protein
MKHGDMVEFCISPGLWRPAMLVRIWTDTCAQVQVFPDRVNDGGPDGKDPMGADWFRSSVSRGIDVGNWRPRE